MPVPPEKLHELLSYCIDFAKTMLNDSGEFYPFGAVLNAEGQVVAVAGHNGEERPNPQELYKLLLNSFIAQAKEGNILAAALAANVTIPSDYSPPVSDGLRVHLECLGFSRFIYVPFSLKRKGLFKKALSTEFHKPIPVQIQAAMFSVASNA